MAWPPSTIATNLTNETLAVDVHAPHHNTLAGEINDLVTFKPVPEAQPINVQTATTYTLVLADASKLVTCDNAAAVTLTVPKNSAVAFPVGTRVSVAGLGVGIVTTPPLPVCRSGCSQPGRMTPTRWTPRCPMMARCGGRRMPTTCGSQAYSDGW